MSSKVRSFFVVGLVALGSVAAAQENERPRPSGQRRANPADPKVEEWVRLLASRIDDESPVIRDSARQAIVAVGRPAVPTLRTIADGGDERASASARRLLERIEERGDPRRPDPIGRALESLDLDPTARREVERIRESHRRHAEELFGRIDSGEIERDRVPDAHVRLHEDLLRQLRGVLDEEQLQRFERKLESTRPGFRGEGRPHGPPPRRGHPPGPRLSDDGAPNGPR